MENRTNSRTGWISNPPPVAGSKAAIWLESGVAAGVGLAGVGLVGPATGVGASPVRKVVSPNSPESSRPSIAETLVHLTRYFPGPKPGLRETAMALGSAGSRWESPLSTCSKPGTLRTMTELPCWSSRSPKTKRTAGGGPPELVSSTPGVGSDFTSDAAASALPGEDRERIKAAIRRRAARLP